MGMPCEINNILKLKPSQGYPIALEPNTSYQAHKDGYRIFPLDVPIALVDEHWVAHADALITKLTWENQNTWLEFCIVRRYPAPLPMQATHDRAEPELNA